MEALEILRSKGQIRVSVSINMRDRVTVIVMMLLNAHTGSRTHWSAVLAACRSSQNGHEAVDGAASEIFARCLHHRYAAVELPSAGDVSFSHAIPCC